MKRFIELVFYLVIIYMIISEFKRDRKREYKYLIVGFFALFFRQAVMSIILFSRIFSVNGFMRFGVLIWFIDTYLETAALILIVSAFVFPAFKEKTFTFQKRIIYSLYLVMQYVVLAITAQNYGKRFVCNVLAEVSSS